MRDLEKPAVMNLKVPTNEECEDMVAKCGGDRVKALKWTYVEGYHACRDALYDAIEDDAIGNVSELFMWLNGAE